MTFQRALTSEQEKELIVEHEDGWTINELSVIYRVSIRTVYRVLADHGVKTGPKKRTNRKSGRQEKKPRELKPCGTDAAYQRHRRKGEYPCEPCLVAHSQDVAYWKAQREKKDKNDYRRVS